MYIIIYNNTLKLHFRTIMHNPFNQCLNRLCVMYCWITRIIKPHFKILAIATRGMHTLQAHASDLPIPPETERV